MEEDFLDISESEEEEKEEKEERITSADRIIKCRHCGKDIVFKNYVAHLKEEHPSEFEEFRRKMGEGRKKAWEKSRKKEVSEESFEEEMPPEQMVALMGREGLEKLKFKRLMELLKTAPNVTSSQVKWVEMRWNTFARIREDPAELFRVLKDEAGIKDKVASAIVQAVFSLESEYADMLAGRGEPIYVGRQWGEERGYPFHIFQRPAAYERYGYRAEEPFPPAYRHAPPGYAAYPPYPHVGYPYFERAVHGEKPLTKEDIIELMDKYLSERIEKREIQEKIDTLRSALEGLKDYVEEQRHEFEKMILKKSVESRERSPEVDFLRSQLERANEQIAALSKQLEAIGRELEQKEKARLESELKSLRAEQRSLYEALENMRKAMSIGGFQNDTYKLISQIVGAAETRRPLETVMKILFPETVITPIQKYHTRTILPPEVESELRSHGLIESYGG